MFDGLADIEFWWIGFALLGIWICVGIIVWIVQNDRRRRRAAREDTNRAPPDSD